VRIEGSAQARVTGEKSQTGDLREGADGAVTRVPGFACSTQMYPHQPGMALEMITRATDLSSDTAARWKNGLRGRAVIRI
jgi:hypothetical protein